MVTEWLRSASYAQRALHDDVTSRRVTAHLIRDERVVVSTRRHFVVAVWPAAASLAALILVGALTAKLPTGSPLIDVLWFGWFVTLGHAAWKLLEWSSDIFVVTDRRVMLFEGFLTRRIAMMPLVKVTDLTYRRTIGGRLLGYGDLIIESAGQDQALHTVSYLPNPSELYHDITNSLFPRNGARANESPPLPEIDRPEPPDERPVDRTRPPGGRPAERVDRDARGATPAAGRPDRLAPRRPTDSAETSSSSTVGESRVATRPTRYALPRPAVSKPAPLWGPPGDTGDPTTGGGRTSAEPDVEDTVTLDRSED